MGFRFAVAGAGFVCPVRAAAGRAGVSAVAGRPACCPERRPATTWRRRDRFLLRDEFYALDRDPAQTVSDFRVVLAFGGFTDPMVSLAFGSAYAAQQPLAWTGSYRGKNRIYYTNLGHSAATWRRPDFQDSLIEAVRWVAAKRPSTTCLRSAGLAPPNSTKKKRNT